MDKRRNQWVACGLFAGLIFGVFASESEKATARVSFAEPLTVPGVKSLDYQAEVEVSLDDAQTVTVACADEKAVSWVTEHAKLWFRFDPKVVSAPFSEEGWTLGDEGYRLTADPTAGIALTAKTLAGMRYAMYTLRQIAERDSVGMTLARFRLPQLKIEDAPTLNFRGIHLCWFPEQSAELIEQEIRVAAYYKYNCVVLEPWGVFKSERHPWFGWRDAPLTKEVVRHLVAVADEVGVTLVPQLNVWGHAAAARSCTGKHATLDVAPERQPLFEPDGGFNGATSAGWNWCLANPDAVRTVRELVAELHDAFGNPPYFHIGCDEADPPSCASCRAQPYAQLVADHIAGICTMLKERGARAMMWHDMLLLHGDPRWKGFYANGSEETARLPALLPKDVIVCDWYYGSDAGGTKDPKERTSLTGSYPTLDYFAEECGFDTLTCPWEEPSGIRAQTRYACDRKLFGVLETTWHHFGGERFAWMVQIAACGAWGGSDRGSRNGRFARAWRHCGWDMQRKDYRQMGWYDTQVTRDILSR